MAGAFIIDAGFLRHAADGTSHALGIPQDIDSRHTSFAGIRPGKRGQDLDGGGFARAVRA